MIRITFKHRLWTIGLITLLFAVSCIKIPVTQKSEDDEPTPDPGDNDIALYTYPFGQENQHVVAQITIQTDGTMDLNQIQTEIPALKYNKSWLCLLTQDDCEHAAYSWTWAAIHGKPLSRQYFYSARQRIGEDFPPDIYSLGKTLGSTDGAGNEIRFSFTTTLAPELPYMKLKSEVKPGYQKEYYRFYMQSGLLWKNVIEMVNFGTGIAFHDVATKSDQEPDSIFNHYEIAQAIIQKKLAGRSCKMLAEPNGNKNYITAAQRYASIKTMTAQTGAKVLYPFQVSDDLHKQVLERVFYNSGAEGKAAIETLLKQPKKQRPAMYLGVHRTDDSWAKLLLWINDMYGQDGDDSVWFPNIEEYYEYNYFRQNSSVERQTDASALKLTVTLPGDTLFIYPSITLNLKGLSIDQITSITSNNTVSGLSYGKYDEGVMVNIDCRAFLEAHAAYFVKQYETKPTLSNLEDARYFVSQLKESDSKQALINRLK